MKQFFFLFFILVSGVRVSAQEAAFDSTFANQATWRYYYEYPVEIKGVSYKFRQVITLKATRQTFFTIKNFFSGYFYTVIAKYDSINYLPCKLEPEKGCYISSEISNYSYFRTSNDTIWFDPKTVNGDIIFPDEPFFNLSLQEGDTMYYERLFESYPFDIQKYTVIDSVSKRLINNSYRTVWYGQTKVIRYTNGVPTYLNDSHPFVFLEGIGSITDYFIHFGFDYRNEIPSKYSYREIELCSYSDPTTGEVTFSNRCNDSTLFVVAGENPFGTVSTRSPVLEVTNCYWDGNAIQYTLAGSSLGQVDISVYDLLGRRLFYFPQQRGNKGAVAMDIPVPNALYVVQFTDRKSNAGTSTILYMH